MSETPRTGRIIAHHGKKVVIAAGGGLVEWKPPHRETWVVGDVVRFVKDRPKTIEPRRNELARISTRKGARQALAANLDWLVIVTACGEAFKPGLVDRFIVAAGHARIGAMVVLNKIDLEGAGRFIEEISAYRNMGVPVHCVSALTGEGLDEFAAALKGFVSAMVGHSGVGKTSLINRLAPGVERAVGAVHEETERGRHVTSSSLMVDLPGGGSLIDAPGIRHFVPTGLEPRDVAAHFPGLDAEGGCKFRDCLHVTEPGCGVREAVDRGGVDRARYESYLRLLASVKESSEPAWKQPEKD